MLTIGEPGLFAADLEVSLNLFRGAGFSTLAKGTDKKALPVGTELKDSIIEHFGRNELSSLDLQSVYTIIASSNQAQLNSLLSTLFNVAEFSPKYDRLRRLIVSHIYTTNIDNLPRQIFRPIAGTSSPIFHDVSRYGLPRDTQNSIQYIPLHGSIEDANPRFVFTAGQISSAFTSDQQTWFVFQRELQVRPTIFLGYGMNDAGVLQALQSANMPSSRRWVLVRPKQPGVEELYKSLGFNVLVGNTEDFLNHLETHVSKKPLALASSRRSQLGAIPRRDEVAQRPVREFFVGTEPEWSDIYSPQV